MFPSTECHHFNTILMQPAQKCMWTSQGTLCLRALQKIHMAKKWNEMSIKRMQCTRGPLIVAVQLPSDPGLVYKKIQTAYFPGICGLPPLKLDDDQVLPHGLV